MPKGKSFKDDFRGYEYMWRHQGKCLDGDKLSFEDALATPEAGYFIPRVITNAIQEAVEPLLIGPSLLTRLQFQPGTFINLPIMGALDGDFDMGEEEEYQEIRVTLGPGTAITSVGKTGVAVKFSEEILRYSSFDVVTMHTSAAGKALARYKERKIFELLLNEGTVTHDNAAPATAQFGTTTGRNLVGAANGSVRMEDLFEAYSVLVANGFIPNLLIVHPLTWLMFVQDPVLRAFALQNGGGAMFQGWTGNPGNMDFPSQFGGQGAAGGNYLVPSHAGQHAGAQDVPSALTNYSQNLTSAPQLPGYFGFPMSVLVSPFMAFNTANNTTDIIMASADELGYFIEDHGLVVEDWTDPRNDILKVKMKERYSLAVKNEGLGIAVLRNVEVTPNEIVLPAQAHIDVGGAIDAINRGVAI